MISKYSLSGIYYAATLCLTLLMLGGITPDEAHSQIITGQVFEEFSNNPIPDVVVSLQDSLQNPVSHTMTDKYGEFFLQAPEPGTYRVHVRQIGFHENSTGLIEMEIDDNLNIEIGMMGDTILMDEITVEADRWSRFLDRQGFYTRQERGLGQFMDRKDIEGMKVSRPSQLFSMIHGVNIRNDGHLLNRRHMETCPMTLVVDGIIMVESRCTYLDEECHDEELRIQPSIDHILQTLNIQAIEIYTSPHSIPQQFAVGISGITPCGAILVWTQS